MIQVWRPVTVGTYRIKRGDVLALHGDDPSDVEKGMGDGFVVGGCAGIMLRTLWEDYREDDEPQLWTKSSSEPSKVRLAMSKVFSQPLPLP